MTSYFKSIKGRLARLGLVICVVMIGVPSSLTGLSRGAPGQIENGPRNGVGKNQTGQKNNVVAPPLRHAGGDEVPVMFNPESPGSCSMVSRGERCGECCIEVFEDGSERLQACVNACDKSEASRREH